MSSIGQYINGAWVIEGTSVEVLSPSDGQSLGSVLHASAKHVANAVSAAHDAAPGWASLAVTDRVSALSPFLTALRDSYGGELRATPLKQLIVDEVGRPFAEADVEVIESADFVDYFLAQAPAVLAEEHPALDRELWPTKASSVSYEPMGVVAIIKPWNYPLELPLWSIVTALVSGNTVVFKPSEHACLVGHEIATMISRCDIPSGTFNCLLGGPEVGQALVESPMVSAVAFTGSVSTGRSIAEVCASRLVRTSLEMGGNDAAIVLDDADVEMAAAGLSWGRFCNTGQVCVSPKRILVHESLMDRFIDLADSHVQQLVAGRDYGPLVSRELRDRVSAYVQDAVSRGATLVSGGSTSPGPGWHFAPTLLRDVPIDSQLWREECFGPVMAVTPYQSLDEAVRLSNASDFGLGASVWSRSDARASDIARQLRVGMVWINDVNIAYPQTPWGGVKMSGLGTELGPWGIREFTYPKHINIDSDSGPSRPWWHPYAPESGE